VNAKKMTVHTQTKTKPETGPWQLRNTCKSDQARSRCAQRPKPEDLHQMRVGCRRLRSAITGFAPALNPPKPAQEKKVGKIARQLGELRDLDVLREAFHSQTGFTLRRTKSLETAFEHLNKQRRQTLNRSRKR